MPAAPSKGNDLSHLPDHPGVLQSYVCQDLDLRRVFRFCTASQGFWSREIEGRLHSVRVATRGQIGPAEWRQVHYMQ